VPDFKDSNFLDAADVAAMLRCDVSTVESKLREGIIPGVKIGRSWVVPKPALVAEMSAQARANSANLRALKERPVFDLRTPGSPASARPETAAKSAQPAYEATRPPGRRRVI
jgi:hypothetical protein